MSDQNNHGATLKQGSGSSLSCPPRAVQTTGSDVALVTLEDQLASKAHELRKLLPQGLEPDRFAAITMRAVGGNPRLLHCDRASLLNEILKCADDGLVPDGREAILTVFEDRRSGRLLARYVPMVQGILKRAKELGDVASVTCHVVHEADRFRVLGGHDDRIEHEITIRPYRGEIIAAYVIFRGKNGETIATNVMTRAEIEATRRLSRMADGEAWSNHFKEMARKTVIRQGAKLVPMSARLRTIIERDDELVDLGRTGGREARAGEAHAVVEYNPGVDHECYDDSEVDKESTGPAPPAGPNHTSDPDVGSHAGGHAGAAGPPAASHQLETASLAEVSRVLQKLESDLGRALSPVGLRKAMSAFEIERWRLPPEAILRAEQLIATETRRVEQRMKNGRRGSRA